MRRFACLALLPLALGACGGSSEPPAAQPSTTSATADEARAAYIAKADALCARFQSKHPEIARSIAKLNRTSEDDPKLIPTLAAHYGLVLGVAREFAREFAKLPPPAADAIRIGELRTANERALQKLSVIVGELEAGNEPSDVFRDYVDELTTANRLAAAYGFEVCSRNS